MIQLDQLCIVERRSAWKVVVDVVCLNDDGSVFDGAFLAAVAALSHSWIPPTVVDDRGIVKLLRSSECGFSKSA